MEVVPQEYKPRFPVAQLTEHPANPNEGDDDAVAGLIDANGFYGACVVQKSTGRILVGNTRYRSALSRGARTLPVILVDVDDDHAASIMVGDNRGRDLSRGYKTATLAELLEGLSATRGLEGTGYVPDDLTDLLKQLDADPRNDVSPFNPDATTDDYYTPAWLFERMGLEFDIDVCSPPEPPQWIPAKRRFTIHDDGLAEPWKGRVWMNPPYSKPAPWVTRWIAHRNGVALLPFAKSAWFEEVWQDADAVTFPGVAASKFVGGAIYQPVFLAAMGATNVRAINKLGPTRLIEPRS